MATSTLGSGTLVLAGTTSGTTTVTATAVAGTTTLTLPAATDTLVGKATTDTLTNKTLTSPVIATIVNSGTLTLPTSTDTLVGKATTDTLTNKTLTSPTLTTPTINSAQVSTVSGSAPLFMARAWVNFNGTGTVAIRGSGNVSSITDNGTGNYTVNFTTAMTDANYAITGAGGEGGTTGMGQRTPSIGTVSTSSVLIASINQDATYVDPVYCCISIFR